MPWITNHNIKKSGIGWQELFQLPVGTVFQAQGFDNSDWNNIDLTILVHCAVDYIEIYHSHYKDKFHLDASSMDDRPFTYILDKEDIFIPDPLEYLDIYD